MLQPESWACAFAKRRRPSGRARSCGFRDADRRGRLRRELKVLREADRARQVRRVVLDVTTSDAARGLLPDEAAMLSRSRDAREETCAWLGDRACGRPPEVARTLDRSRARVRPAAGPAAAGGPSAGIARAYGARAAAPPARGLRSHRFRRAIKARPSSRFLRPSNYPRRSRRRRELARPRRLLDRGARADGAREMDWTEATSSAPPRSPCSASRARCQKPRRQRAPLGKCPLAERPKDRSRRLEAAFRAAPRSAAQRPTDRASAKAYAGAVARLLNERDRSTTPAPSIRNCATIMLVFHLDEGRTAP
jgi:hypothetical protein